MKRFIGRPFERSKTRRARLHAEDAGPGRSCSLPPRNSWAASAPKKAMEKLVDFRVAVAHDWGKSQHPDFSIARTAGLLRRLGYVLCRKIACIPIWDV